MSSSVIVIGNFDGVHLGHRAVLDHARALEPEATVYALTFWPHPSSVVRAGHGGPKLLCELDERVELLLGAGADRVEVVHFTEEFSRRSPEEFVRTVLLPLQPKRVVVGENFRFGHRAAGDVAALTQLGEGHFEVSAIDLVPNPVEPGRETSEAPNSQASSTNIRAALSVADIRGASRMLGRPYSFTGTVVKGDQRGREMGFPTANLVVNTNRSAPADGVYAGWVTCTGEEDSPALPAAISVGSNPTFDGTQLRVESYILDRTDLDLYGVEIRVEFVEAIRGQVKFEGMEALIAQMHEDVAQIREILTADARNRPHAVAPLPA